MESLTPCSLSQTISVADRLKTVGLVRICETITPSEIPARDICATSVSPRALALAAAMARASARSSRLSSEWRSNHLLVPTPAASACALYDQAHYLRCASARPSPPPERPIRIASRAAAVSINPGRRNRLYFAVIIGQVSCREAGGWTWKPPRLSLAATLRSAPRPRAADYCRSPE